MTHIPVLKIAKLSNLVLSDAELEKFDRQLGDTIAYMSNLQELDVKLVRPTSSPTGNVNGFFEDGINNTRTLPAAAYKVSRVL